ncbi:MAG: hypothetical protein JWM78_1670 [Verrucomicrobiaceae bacterium]|nr:hypothetical protein [Verrucomicrobiaceae bacterium]
MFVLKKRPGYFWPVKFQIPLANGKFEEHEFSAEFARIPQQRLDSIAADLQNKKSKITDEDIVKEVFIGWKDVTDEVGDAILFNEENRATLLNVPGVRTAIVKAFYESIAGAAEKN